MLRTTIFKALAGVAVGIAMTCAAISAGLRYAQVGAEGDIQTIYAAEAAKGIAAATNNVTAYPASQLGGVAEMVDGVKMGSIQMGHHDFASLARLVPEVAVFNSCLKLAVTLDGADIVTIEGLGSGTDLHPLQSETIGRSKCLPDAYSGVI